MCENETLMDKTNHIKRYAIHMSRIGTFVSLASLSIISYSAKASDPSIAGDIIRGQEYHDEENRWIPRNISVFIGMDEKGKKYFLFKGETAQGGAFVILDRPQEFAERLEDIASKAIKLSHRTRKSRTDKVIYLGCFSAHMDSTGMKDIVSYTVAYKENEISFRFISRNRGQQTELVIDLVDRLEISCRATIHLDERAMLKLLDAATKIRKNLEKANVAQPTGASAP
jgi:hypothetical protein